MLFRSINVNNLEVDALTRKFAQMAGVGITDAIVITMREAIVRPRRDTRSATAFAGTSLIWQRPFPDA